MFCKKRKKYYWLVGRTSVVLNSLSHTYYPGVGLVDIRRRIPVLKRNPNQLAASFFYCFCRLLAAIFFAAAKSWQPACKFA